MFENFLFSYNMTFIRFTKVCCCLFSQCLLFSLLPSRGLMYLHLIIIMLNMIVISITLALWDHRIASFVCI